MNLIIDGGFSAIDVSAGECEFLDKPIRNKKWFCPNCITFSKQIKCRYSVQKIILNFIMIVIEISFYKEAITTRYKLNSDLNL